jgi:hypothetical protein
VEERCPRGLSSSKVGIATWRMSSRIRVVLRLYYGMIFLAPHALVVVIIIIVRLLRVDIVLVSEAKMMLSVPWSVKMLWMWMEMDEERYSHNMMRMGKRKKKTSSSSPLDEKSGGRNYDGWMDRQEVSLLLSD